MIPVSPEVKCYTRFDGDSGNCDDLWLLGEVTMDDCCLNPHYGYIGSDGKCKSCHLHGLNGLLGAAALSPVRREFRRDDENARDRENVLRRLAQERFRNSQQGQWSKWGQWQPCSVTCDKGVRNRVRTCTEPQPRCGGSCDGPSEELEPCVVDRVCPTHGGWSNWENWQPCSGTCVGENLPRPTQQRNRACNKPPPSSVPPGDECPGLGSNTRTCDELPFCPGKWHGKAILFSSEVLTDNLKLLYSYCM
ncbi:unnamed protein product [Coregonus sp. 'balchen']|nr:unnamed protein product [Coregonus sp. 'balchen']